MTQYSYNNNIDPTVNNGLDLDNALNAWEAALNSNHSGTTRPSYLPANATWVKTASATESLLMIYDGVSDIQLAKINPTTHAVEINAQLFNGVALSDFVRYATSPTFVTYTPSNDANDATKTGMYTVSGTANVIYATSLLLHIERASGTGVTAFQINISSAGKPYFRHATGSPASRTWSTWGQLLDTKGGFTVAGGVTFGTNGDLTVGDGHTLYVEDDAVSGTRLRVIADANRIYFQAYAKDNTSIPKEINFAGYDGADAGAFTVRKGGTYRDILYDTHPTVTGNDPRNWGIGLTDSSAISDLNTINTSGSGVYEIGNTTSNRPSGISYGTVWHHNLATTTWTQTVIAEGNKIYSRVCVSGVIGSWKEVGNSPVKAMVEFNGVGTPTITGANVNVSSVSDLGTGTFRINFTTPITGDYFTLGLSHYGVTPSLGSVDTVREYNKTTTYVDIYVVAVTPSSSVFVDRDVNKVVIYGV